MNSTFSKNSRDIEMNLVKLYNQFNQVTANTEHISRKRSLVKDILMNWSKYSHLKNKLTFKMLMESSY